MTGGQDDSLVSRDLSEFVRKVRVRTPARLLAGRSGAAYRTETQMELRESHAAARDAVRIELNPERDLGKEVLEKWGLFEVRTTASSKDDYLLRPDHGRHFDATSERRIQELCPPARDLQIVVGDGLSIAALRTQVPQILPMLMEGAAARGWTIGRGFIVRYCRVGILNEIGELLLPKVAILLIGERPGLATAESLSAYMAYRPKAGDTDANRNLISNIHDRGLRAYDAASRTLNLAAKMMAQQTSGHSVRSD